MWTFLFSTFLWTFSLKKFTNFKSWTFSIPFEDSNSEPDVDLENQYYNAKSMKDDDPDAALNGFNRVLELEEDKGEWGTV